MAGPLSAGDRHTHTHTHGEHYRGFTSVCSPEASHTSSALFSSVSRLIQTLIINTNLSLANVETNHRRQKCGGGASELQPGSIRTTGVSLPSSLFLARPQISAPCQTPSCHRCVRWAKSEEGIKGSVGGKTGTRCLALSEISSSSLTFGFTHLIFLSDKVHKHTLQVEELGKRAHFGFLDEFGGRGGGGGGDVTSRL